MKENKQLIEEILTHQQKLYFFCAKLYNYKDKESAEDLTQEVIFKAISKIPSLKSTDNIKSWLYTIAKNTFINEYRSKKVKPKSIFITEQSENLVESIPDNYDSIQNVESNVEFIYAQLKRVNPKYLKCIELYMEGNKMKDISLILNIPINTVKSRILIGRKEMRKNIQPILETLDFEIRD